MKLEIKKVLGKNYSIKKPKTEKKCYICQILSEDKDNIIGAHSISKGNNLKGKRWLGWEHDVKAEDNKFFYEIEKLVEISEHKASVTYTVCSRHDMNFAVFFEQDRIIDINHHHHLMLLALRTFINFHSIAQEENLHINIRIKKLLEDVELFKTKDEKELLNSILERAKYKKNLNNKIINNNLIEIIEDLTKCYWDKNYNHVYMGNGGTIDVFSLYRDLNFLMIPLKSEPAFVGSFFIDFNDFNSHLTIQESDFDVLKKAIKDKSYLNDDDFEYDLENNLSFAFKSGNNKKYEELVSVHVLNNGGNPFIVFQCFNSYYQTLFLSKLFFLLKRNSELFFEFLANIIVKNKNVFFEKSFISQLKNNELENLISSHNSEIKLNDSLFSSIKKNINIDFKNTVLCVSGTPLYLRKKEEPAPFFKIIGAVGGEDDLFSYIHLEFMLGNGYYYHQKFSVEGYSSCIYYGNEPENLILALNACNFAIDFWLNDNDDRRLSKRKKKQKCKKEINKIFSSKYGNIYYEFLSILSNLIFHYVKYKIGSTKDCYVYVGDIDINELRVFLIEGCVYHKLAVDIKI